MLACFQRHTITIQFCIIVQKLLQKIRANPHLYRYKRHFIWVKEKVILIIIIISDNFNWFYLHEGMSVGDVIRLNRMYKCGDNYITNFNQLSASTKKPEKEINQEAQGNRSDARKIFGILIFQSRT